jgi:hypothetical protein
MQSVTYYKQSLYSEVDPTMLSPEYTSALQLLSPSHITMHAIVRVSTGVKEFPSEPFRETFPSWQYFKGEIKQWNAANVRVITITCISLIQYQSFFMEFAFDNKQGNLAKLVPGIVQGKVVEISFAYIFPDDTEDGTQKGTSLLYASLTTAIAVVKSINWSSTAFNHTPEDGGPSTPRSRPSSSMTTPNGKRPRASPFAITPKTPRPASTLENESDGTLNNEDLPPPPKRSGAGKGGAGKKLQQ